MRRRRHVLSVDLRSTYNAQAIIGAISQLYKRGPAHPLLKFTRVCPLNVTSKYEFVNFSVDIFRQQVAQLSPRDPHDALYQLKYMCSVLLYS